MKVLLRFYPYIRPYRRVLLASMLLAIPVAITRGLPVQMLRWFLDGVLPSRNPNKVLLFSLAFVGLFVLNFVVRFFHYYLMRVVVARVNQRLKNSLYQHLLGLSADYFTAQSTGALMARVGSDTQYVDSLLTSIGTAVREPLTFFYLFASACAINWRLTLIVLLVFPPLAWVFSATGRNLKRYIHKLTDQNAQVYSALQESFTGIRVVQSFRLERYLRKKFKDKSDEYTRFYMKITALEEASHPAVELLTAMAVAGVIFYGGMEVIGFKMSIGELNAFFMAFGLMINPLRTLNDLNIKFHSGTAALKRIYEVFDWKTRLHEPVNPIPFKEFRKEITFDRVSFAYPDAPERPVLTGVSFNVQRGAAVAIVGASGAGKSSLVSLLPRLFDVTGGAIRIDGRDIRELGLDDLRKQISVVSQDVFLFIDTIEENIRCGRLSATKDEIREAADRAHALDFIERIPEGFHAVIGDRGQKLSGGEKQRISIARAFLRQAPILILDEATSSLDSHSERAVQSALEELMRDRTTLVIAHRLSTIRNVDRIIVLRDGQVVETGGHDELMLKGGEYARFHHFTEHPPIGT